MKKTINKSELQEASKTFLSKIEKNERTGLKKLLIQLSNLPNMSKKYIKVLKLRECEMYTYKQLGDEFGLTRQRMREIHYKALLNIEEGARGHFRIFGSVEVLA